MGTDGNIDRQTGGSGSLTDTVPEHPDRSGRRQAGRSPPHLELLRGLAHHVGEHTGRELHTALGQRHGRH